MEKVYVSEIFCGSLVQWLNNMQPGTKIISIKLPKNSDWITIKYIVCPEVA